MKRRWLWEFQENISLKLRVFETTYVAIVRYLARFSQDLAIKDEEGSLLKTTGFPILLILVVLSFFSSF
ncbi:MAG TPA: hypothetical protein DD384_05120 [Firmicutes bacterium]|nr:hypothetical protein [Bacillota bacterium]